MPKPQLPSDPAIARLLGIAQKAPAEMLRAIEAAKCERPGGLYRFVKLMWPTVEPSRKFIPGWHIEAICSHLEAISRGDIKRLLINVPPGSSKSLITSVFWPAWEWITYPSLRYLCFSYSNSLTIRDNVRFRQLILSPEYRELWGDRFDRSPDQFSLITVANDKTGWKQASSLGGVATGARADRLICFPYEGMIITEDGVRPIGELVEGGYRGRVASLSPHGLDWRPIVAFHRNRSPKTLLRITHEDGEITCTDEHPIYVRKRGFIKARDIRIGDKIGTQRIEYLYPLRKNGLPSSESSAEILQQNLQGFALVRGVSAEKQRAMCGIMWKDGVSHSGSSGENRKGILQQRMRPHGNDRAGKSSISNWQGEENLPMVSGRVRSKSQRSSAPDLLLSFLPREGALAYQAEGSSSPVMGMRRMRRIISNPYGREPLLLKALQECGPFQGDDGNGEWSICPRRTQEGIWFWVDSPISHENQIAGRREVSSLWNETIGSRQETLCSSYRLQQAQSGPDEPDNSLSVVPWENAWFAEGEGILEGTNVKFIEVVSGTDWVYNIEVEENHNYFCDGVLVHNCDDPNNAADVESELVRESTNDFFTTVLPTRLNSPEHSAIVVIQQRVHSADVSGTILSQGLPFEHLMIPMEHDGQPRQTSIGWRDPRSYDHRTGLEVDNLGALMWPAMYPRHTLDELKRTMPPYAYAGQFQQIPVPKGGQIFQIDDWRHWPPEEEDQKWVSPEGKIIYPPMDYIVASVDTAFTQKEENDFSAMVVLGVFRDAGTRMAAPTLRRSESDPVEFLRLVHDDRPKVMLMHAWEKRLSLHGPPEHRPLGVTDDEWNSPEWKAERQQQWGLVEWVADTCKRYRVSHLLIETQAQGHGLEQELRRLHSNGDWGVELIPARGGRGAQTKVERAYAVQHLFANGLIYAPHNPDTGTPLVWADRVITTMGLFPRDKHDDLTDAVVHCLQHLRDSGILVRGEEFDADNADLMIWQGNKPPLYEV